jgi:hypothetical protein
MNINLSAIHPMLIGNRGPIFFGAGGGGRLELLPASTGAQRLAVGAKITPWAPAPGATLRHDRYRGQLCHIWATLCQNSGFSVKYRLIMVKCLGLSMWGYISFI